MARSASWQDVDGDRIPDLFLVQPDGKSVLFRGLGGGQFADATQASGLDRAQACTRAHWLDYDQDGHADLELWSAQGVQLLHNDGLGVLEPTPHSWTLDSSATGVPASLDGSTAGEPRTAPAAGASPATPAPPTARAVVDRTGTFAPGGSGREAVSIGASASAHPGGTLPGAAAVQYCAPGIQDQAGPGSCLNASSIPELGSLYPLSPEFFVDSNGEIGFGTTDPRSQVHLRGGGSVAAMRVDTTSNDGTSKLLLLENGNAIVPFGGQISYDGLQDQLQLSTLTATTENVRVAIERSTGDVGIGTTTPAHRLHIAGTDPILAKIESSNATATRLELENTDQTGYAYDIGVTGSAANVGSSKLVIRDVTSGNNARVTVDSLGNVGIGTTGPTERLHVNGNIRVADNADISGLDQLVGFDDLRLYGDSVGGPDFRIYTDGQCGVGVVYTNVSLNVTGGPLMQGNDALLNVELSDSTDVFEIQADQEVIVNGDFSVINGSKNFMLDHPLDPANKSLAHNAVEGPGNYTFYRGNVVLDAHGAAWVELPDYFDALNAEPSYQLTCIGAPAPVYVAEEIQDNRFLIAGGRAGLKVSWQVTGLRDDPYARDNPYREVIEKTGDERGRYHYPAGYGAAVELGIHRMPEAGAPATAIQDGSADRPAERR